MRQGEALVLQRLLVILALGFGGTGIVYLLVLRRPPADLPKSMEQESD
jgi:hypothetical protein